MESLTDKRDFQLILDKEIFLCLIWFVDRVFNFGS